ncbi:MAG: amidase, partial [Alphaproteobacteria bacterium]|nr:amidase [Alphaproteobacteria bacterium]
LKPTYGRVSLYGIMPRCWSLDVAGPLARTVRDAAMMLQAVAGYDARDPWSRAVAVPDYMAGLGRPIKGMRIAVPSNHFVADTAPEIRAVHAAALEVLRGLGADIVPLAMPDPEELYQWTTVINRVEPSHIHREWIATRRQDYNFSTVARIAQGFDVPALKYIDALERRDRANASFQTEVFAKADALYCPLLLMDVPTIAETDIRTEASAPVVVHRITQATRWVSFVGLPVLSLPVGFSPAGLPVGAQLIAPRFEEARLLTIGDAYQGATDWHRKRPPHSA